jgi:hypothetical protein
MSFPRGARVWTPEGPGTVKRQAQNVVVRLARGGTHAFSPSVVRLITRFERLQLRVDLLAREYLTESFRVSIDPKAEGLPEDFELGPGDRVTRLRNDGAYVFVWGPDGEGGILTPAERVGPEVFVVERVERVAEDTLELEALETFRAP